MAYPRDDIFTKHSQNLFAINKTLTQVERIHKAAIRAGNQPEESALRKIHLLLVGVMAEAQLKKIIRDPTGFNTREREILWRERNQKDRWVRAVDLATRRHYRVPIHLEVEEVVPGRVLGRINQVKELLEGHLDSVIVHRNKIAHGEWVWQLKSQKVDQFRSEQIPLDYNYCAIIARASLIKLIAEMVHLLVVSEPTFDREFENVTASIQRAEDDLEGLSFDTFADELKRTRLQESGQANP